MEISDFSDFTVGISGEKVTVSIDYPGCPGETCSLVSLNVEQARALARRLWIMAYLIDTPTPKATGDVAQEVSSQWDRELPVK